MLRIFLALFLSIAATPLIAAPQARKTMQAERNEVTGDQLKSWYDQKKNMVVLDARSKPYFNGVMLPRAKWLPAESTSKEIERMVPSKNTMVVLYCAGVSCPASGMLYDKMVELGYTNLYEYHAGLEEWMKKGYPTMKQ